MTDKRHRSKALSSFELSKLITQLKLPGKEKSVLRVLADHWPNVRPSVGRIAKLSGWGTTETRKQLRILEELGLIIAKSGKNRERGVPVEYEMNLPVIWTRLEEDAKPQHPSVEVKETNLNANLNGNSAEPQRSPQHPSVAEQIRTEQINLEQRERSTPSLSVVAENRPGNGHISELNNIVADVAMTYPVTAQLKAEIREALEDGYSTDEIRTAIRDTTIQENDRLPWLTIKDNLRPRMDARRKDAEARAQQHQDMARQKIAIQAEAATELAELDRQITAEEQIAAEELQRFGSDMESDWLDELKTG